MSSTTAERAATGPSDRAHPTGWIVCASVYLIAAGVYTIVNGFTMQEHRSFFTNQIIVDHYTLWAIVFATWGTLQVIAGAMSLTGRITGYMIGVSLAGVAVILWVLVIFSGSFPALIGVAINVAVVYSFTAGAFPEQWR